MASRESENLLQCPLVLRARRLLPVAPAVPMSMSSTFLWAPLRNRRAAVQRCSNREMSSGCQRSRSWRNAALFVLGGCYHYVGKLPGDSGPGKVTSLCGHGCEACGKALQGLMHRASVAGDKTGAPLGRSPGGIGPIPHRWSAAGPRRRPWPSGRRPTAARQSRRTAHQGAPAQPVAYRWSRCRP